MITSLPEKFDSEKEQLEKIEKLAKEHEVAGERLEKAREQASKLILLCDVWLIHFHV